MRSTNLYAGAVCVLISLLCIAWIIPSNTSPAESELDLSPALLPYIAASISLFLGAILFLSALRQPAAEGVDSDEEFGADASGIGRQEIKNLLIWIGISIATLLLLQSVGYVATVGLLLAAVMYYANVRNWILLLSVAIAVPVVIDQIAWHLFSIELPVFPLLAE